MVTTTPTTPAPPAVPKTVRWGPVVAGIVWIVVLAIGLQGLYDRLVFGSQLTDLGGWIPWGLWVATYMWFIGLSAGAFLLSTLVYVFGMKQLERVAPLALIVALVTLIMAMLMIWFDIGHMGRIFEIYYRGNPHSMMAWMGWLYGTYFVLLLAETYVAIRNPLIQQRSRPGVAGGVARLLTGRRATPLTEPELQRGRRITTILGAIGIPLAIAFHGGVGALLATVAARDVWHTGLYPIIFIVGAFFSGGALFMGLIAFFWPMRDEAWATTMRVLGRITLGLLLFEVLLEFADLQVPLWYGVGPEVKPLTQMLTGPFWWVFWLLEVGGVYVIPALLLIIKPRSPRTIGVAGLLSATLFLAVRINLVIPGLVTPELPNLQWSYHDGRLLYSYVPTWPEWELVLFVVAIGVALYWLGVRYLPVVRRETP